MSRVIRRAGLAPFLGCLLVIIATFNCPLSHTFAWANAPEEIQESKREVLFKWINFALLVGALVFVLRKPLGEFFTQRSNSIRRSLEEGRKALEASQAQLNAIDEKLRRLEVEIAAFKASLAQEIAAERERLRTETEEETQRILESARVQIERAAKAARLELKAYTARQAIDLAERIIRERLDDTGRKRLVRRFLEAVDEKPKVKTLVES